MATETIIFITFLIALVAIGIIVVINTFRHPEEFSTFHHVPPRPAPMPKRPHNQPSPLDGGGDDGCGCGLGAGIGGLCGGMTTPSCICSLSFPISNGFENIFNIEIGIADGILLNAPTVTVKKPIDGSLHAGNRSVKTIELRFGSIWCDSTGVKASVQPLQCGYILSIEGNGLGDCRKVRFTRNNNGNTASNNRQSSRYNGGNKSHNRTERVAGNTHNGR